MPLKVGIVRDDRFLLHQTGLVHPERPGRLKTVYRMVEKDFDGRLIRIEAEPATLEHLELVHTPSHIRKILRTAGRDFTNLAPDTSAGPQSYMAAWLVAGACIKALGALLAGRCDVCFVLGRPPGHHALPDRAGGFCIFNNIGIAARYAVERCGFRRILVIDYDVHHGNGIQDLFYEDDEVFYFSTHYMGWYPHTGDWEETGAGKGLGYNLNVPIPKDIQDEDLGYLYHKILGPVMKRYRPELIFVAAGFDGHNRDPLGRTQLTEKCYRVVTEILLDLREQIGAPPVLMSLEGGYDVSALAACVHEVLGVLTRGERRDRVAVALSPKGSELVDRAVRIHGKYHVWTD